MTVQSSDRLMRRYVDAAVVVTVALVLLPVLGLPRGDIVAVAVAIAFIFYVCLLTLRLRRAGNPHALLFGVSSLSLAIFLLSVAIGAKFGSPAAGNWFFPSVSLITGLVTLCANVGLFMKAQSQAET